MPSTSCGPPWSPCAAPLAPTGVWVDAPMRPELPCASVTVVGGDRLVPAISAASILAKVARDAEMVGLDDHRYPGYGLARHKGYATLAHHAALLLLGPSPIHHRSFAPVSVALQLSLAYAAWITSPKRLRQKANTWPRRPDP